MFYSYWRFTFASCRSFETEAKWASTDVSRLQHLWWAAAIRAALRHHLIAWTLRRRRRARQLAGSGRCIGHSAESEGGRLAENGGVDGRGWRGKKKKMCEEAHYEYKWKERWISNHPWLLCDSAWVCWDFRWDSQSIKRRWAWWVQVQIPYLHFSACHCKVPILD